MYKKILELRDDEPQSKRDLALAYIDLGDYQKALNLFNKIITNEWDNLDDRFPLFKSTVLYEMNNLIALHKDSLDLSEINAELIHPMPVDVRIVLDWNMLETDLGLWITEPGGEKSFYSNELTVLGGRLNPKYALAYLFRLGNYFKTVRYTHLTQLTITVLCFVSISACFTRLRPAGCTFSSHNEVPMHNPGLIEWIINMKTTMNTLI